jgi:hypothetical protein
MRGQTMGAGVEGWGTPAEPGTGADVLQLTLVPRFSFRRGSPRAFGAQILEERLRMPTDTTLLEAVRRIHQ